MTKADLVDLYHTLLLLEQAGLMQDERYERILYLIMILEMLEDDL